MTYIVTDNCIKCKYMDCVEVCPVDCFYEGENMLVIHPDECIDCGVCEPECPADAIKPDTEPGLDKWLKINTEYAPLWPNITVKRDGRRTARSSTGSRASLRSFSRRSRARGIRLIGLRHFTNLQRCPSSGPSDHLLPVSTGKKGQPTPVIPFSPPLAGRRCPDRGG